MGLFLCPNIEGMLFGSENPLKLAREPPKFSGQVI